MLRHPTRLVVELGWHPTRRAWVWNYASRASTDERFVFSDNRVGYGGGMIVYASLRLVVRHDDEVDVERCLCGAPHGHPTVRWACTARSSVTARILAQRRASRDQPAGVALARVAGPSGRR
ncbi:MAG: hypothetical protein F4X98_17120 [Gammaproteobacteria bacterium]|nr:hypothetical protein [Gammaproteobacteria bacterium]